MTTQATPPDSFIIALGVHPIVARILWQRGLHDVAAAQGFLDPARYSATSPSDLPDLGLAVARLQHAIATGERIRIWGDFDVDGQTSTSVLLLGLQSAGAIVDFTIPNRAHFSHGLNAQGIQQAQADGVRVLLTCDCGVTDYEPIALARSLGLDVIITDHHDLGPSLPEVTAVLNPKRLPESHPLRQLPGVGVAFLLIQGLCLASGLPLPPLLDLVALGIVADLAEQRADTRHLLQLGLQQVRKSPRLGIRALLGVAGADPARADAETIGFQLAPRLNAAGRLETASLSVELLTAHDVATAQALALRIDALNTRRKDVQRNTQQEALAMLQANPALSAGPVIVLACDHWDPAVLGLVASGITDRLHKPAVVIATPAGKLARGSARSVAGVDIHSLIETQAHFLEHSGGHPMAAGLGLQASDVNAFRAGINAAAQKAAPHMRAVDRRSANALDLDLQDATLALADALEPLAPFGNGNQRPVFRLRAVRIARVEPFGADRRHLGLYVRDDDGITLRLIRWNSDLTVAANPDLPRSLLITLHRSEFGGRQELRCELKAIEDAPPTLPAQQPADARFDIIDLRDAPDRVARLTRWPDATVWAADGWPAPASVLVITVAPANMAELSAALEAASPSTVVLATTASVPATDTPEGFARALAGLLKVAEKRGDITTDDAVITRMARRIGHASPTVRAALAGDHKGVALLLAETRAYRMYFHTSGAGAVLRV